MIPQYAFAGDYTGMYPTTHCNEGGLTHLSLPPVEAIAQGVTEVAKYDADDWFVIAITVRASIFLLHHLL